MDLIAIASHSYYCLFAYFTVANCLLKIVTIPFHVQHLIVIDQPLSSLSQTLIKKYELTKIYACLDAMA